MFKITEKLLEKFSKIVNTSKAPLTCPNTGVVNTCAICSGYCTQNCGGHCDGSCKHSSR